MKLRATYRLNFIIGLISGLSGLLSYALLGASAYGSVTVKTYGMSLGAYLVSGTAFGSIIILGPSLFAQSGLARAEEILATPTSFREYIILSSLIGMLITLATSIAYFSVSVLTLGISYNYNVILLTGVVIVGVVCSIGLGLFGLSISLVYKQSSLFSWLILSATGLIGNMIVPVEIFPPFIRNLSYIVPQYYFFTLIRVSLGANGIEAPTLFASFVAWSAALVFAGNLSLSWALRSIRRDGTFLWV